MTTTVDYSLTHRAILVVGSRNGLTPNEVRTLIALRDRGGEAYADELADDLRSEGSVIRKAIKLLRPTWVSGGDRRGVRASITLTAHGQAVAEQFDSWRQSLEKETEDEHDS
jgi:hypothetical protein